MSNKETPEYLYKIVESSGDNDALITLCTLMEVAKDQRKRVLELESKQLSMDKLRQQFELETDMPSQISWDGEDYMYYGEDSDINSMLDEIRVRWYSWKNCSRVNNLVKE